MKGHFTAVRRYWALCILILTLAVGALPAAPTQAAAPDRGTGTYTNPLPIDIPGDGMMQSCADPSIMHGQQPGDHSWYVYCTTDPLNDQDRQPNGDFNFHLIPMLSSDDLVHWTYRGDVFAAKPPWVAANAGLWAPDIRFFNGQYYLYYTASDTSLPGGGSAIGVVTSTSPLGPWTDSGGPVVEPHAADCCPGSRRWVFDPDVVTDTSGQPYIIYGSYFGGISARRLSADHLHSDPASQVQITIDNRYEGAYIVRHGGYYYLFASATDCCRGPLTGYSVFVGRSANLLGPYVDQTGASLLAARVGGTPAISMNGNEWVGTGHNAVFTDFGGQDWFLYHAIDRTDPYFADPNPGRINKRHLMMDPLDWINGWPQVRAGRWASDFTNAVPAPAAQPGQHSRYTPHPPPADVPGDPIARLSDDFNGATLGAQWSWVRQPMSTTYGVSGGTFRFDTQNADLYVDSNTASVLTENAPRGNYIVDTRVHVTVPPDGCCYNYVQAGMVIYGDDDNYIKLASVSIFNTRQTEFASEISPVPAGWPRYGNTVVGPPGDWTYLRIARSFHAGDENYRAYTSTDGTNWVRGGVWTQVIGSVARIGLVSMGGSGFTANFDYVHVYRLDHADDQP